MEEIWEFLLNNSPKLVCKPRSKTPKESSENRSEVKPVTKKTVKNPARSPLKQSLINSSSTPRLTTPTIQSNKPKLALSKAPSKVGIIPITTRKKITPILSSVKSFKIFKSCRK